MSNVLSLHQQKKKTAPTRRRRLNQTNKPSSNSHHPLPHLSATMKFSFPMPGGGSGVALFSKLIRTKDLRKMQSDSDHTSSKPKLTVFATKTFQLFSKADNLWNDFSSRNVSQHSTSPRWVSVPAAELECIWWPEWWREISLDPEWFWAS